MRQDSSTRREFLRGTAAWAAASVLAPCVQAATVVSDGIEAPVTVTPQTSDEVLVNPGIGMETFWSFQGDRVHFDREVENYPRSSIAYFRYYWDELEEGEGQYQFDEIDFLLKKARKRGQDLALRFMGFNFGMRYPEYLMKRARGHEVQLERNRFYPAPLVRSWVPDFNDAYFLSRLEAFLAAFGHRYNGHPELIRLDIGSVGRWGEWHCSSVCKEAPMPTEANACKVIDWYFRYWNKTPLSMLIGYVPGLRHAVNKGAGWRADSLGDWRGAHMEKMYPRNLKAADALEAYRGGPVTFEPQRDMEYLKQTVVERGHSYDELWDRALCWGASSFNGKSTTVPTDQVKPLERFLKRCGYRFVLRSLTTSRQATATGGLRVRLEFENVGVAPPYKDYVVAIRLKNQADQAILDAPAKLTAWLPGRHLVDTRLPLPASVKPGRYDLAVGVLDPHYRDPEVRLAIQGPVDHGWYPLTSIEVT